MNPLNLVFVVLFINCCSLIQLIKCSDDGDGDPEDDARAKEEKDSKEMEAFMKLMIKSGQKNLKRLLETVDIGSLSSSKCNSSWHQFMTDNELSPERFSTILEDYKSGNHEKIVKIVRPEQCLINDNGKFCQIDHVTNITIKSKARVFDLTYALCYPRGCTNTELNDILTALTDTYKGTMIQVKLNVIKCITSMENVTKMEIDTAQKLLSKMSGGMNQTFDLGKFKLPGPLGNVATTSSLPSPFHNPFTGSSFSFLSLSSSSSSSLPNLPINVPDDVPMFSFEDLGLPRQFSPIEPSTPPPSPPPHHYHHHIPPSTIMSTSTPENARPEMVIPMSSSSTPSPIQSQTPLTSFKWPETDPTEPLDSSNPLRYPDINYSDELSESYKSSSPVTTTPSTSPPNPLIKLDKTRLLKMIPGLIVHDDDDD